MNSTPTCTRPTPPVSVWTLRTDGIDEPFAARWRGVLDTAEQAQADRFVFASDRIQYIAAHALLRGVLSSIVPDADPAAWRLVSGKNGKPVAWLCENPAPLSFNLSHTDGMVGVAAVRGANSALGFDLEALDRKVTLDIAARFFRPEEVAWLGSLPEPVRRDGFLQLWTLKEAFIKATGKGLAQSLSSFWFTTPPPRIHFTPALPERAEDWHFEQRVVAERWMAAVGLCQPDGANLAARWIEVRPDQASDAGLFRL
ncbi:MAG: 4'-phosphopantetheinyl transferase superfamily protein [Rhodopila sp.]|jgi:4'-phosphopantetheinyl transferase